MDFVSFHLSTPLWRAEGIKVNFLERSQIGGSQKQLQRAHTHTYTLTMAQAEKWIDFALLAAQVSYKQGKRAN